MRLTFYGATDTVTGSCFLLDTGKLRLLVDCGLFQGRKEIRKRNYEPFPFAPDSINLVLLTHAHIDHSGLLPKLVKHGFRGRILATRCTVELCRVLLPDSGSIQESEVAFKNRKAKRSGQPQLSPIYTEDDAYRCLEYFAPVDYDRTITLADGVDCCFRDAGHILGSALIQVRVAGPAGETKLVFSGDLGNQGKPFVRNPTSVLDADYLVMESTYGDRMHLPSEEAGREALKRAIWNTYNKGGNLLIPAFAVERTQDFIYYIFTLDRNGELPPVDVWLDSPLAVAITRVFGRYPQCFDEETSNLVASGIDPLGAPHLKLARTVEESRALNESPGPNIIIAGSGMCDGGRIRHHLKHNLWRPESTVLFVGYQAEGTLGRYLVEGAQRVRLFGEDIMVKADIVNVNGFSAHADQKMLLEWVAKFQVRPRRIFLVHGEANAVAALQELLGMAGFEAYRPGWQETVILGPGRTVEERLWQVFSGLRTRTEAYLKMHPEPEAYNRVLQKLVALDADLAGGAGDENGRSES